MPTHSEKVLLAKIERARANLLFADEKEGRQALEDLAGHVPADPRLGSCLSEIDSLDWDALIVEKRLKTLSNKISKDKTAGVDPKKWTHYPVSDWTDYLDKGETFYTKDGIMYEVGTDKKLEAKEITNFKAALIVVTKEGFSDLVGVSSATVSNWEKGQAPSGHNQKKVIYLANALRRRGGEWFKENLNGKTRAEYLQQWKRGQMPAELDFS